MAALNCGEDRAQGEFRLAIDRSFVLAGVGVVVTGTVAAGTVSVGDRAMLTPSGIEVRIRGIRAHNRAASTGRAGERCALNLAGAQVNRERVRRGDWSSRRRCMRQPTASMSGCVCCATTASR